MLLLVYALFVFTQIQNLVSQRLSSRNLLKINEKYIWSHCSRNKRNGLFSIYIYNQNWQILFTLFKIYIQNYEKWFHTMILAVKNFFLLQKVPKQRSNDEFVSFLKTLYCRLTWLIFQDAFSRSVYSVTIYLWQRISASCRISFPAFSSLF